MKNMIILVVLFYFFGCSTAPVKEPAVINEAGPVNEIAQGADFVKVISVTNFTEEEKNKLLKYIVVMNDTIASQCFEKFMLEREAIQTNDKTNGEVIADLRTKKVEIHLTMYNKSFSKVAGYTLPGQNRIWLNRKYHAGASLCSEASNLAHELSHKLGYEHDYKASQRRPFSVPYSINAAFTACCN